MPLVGHMHALTEGLLAKADIRLVKVGDEHTHVTIVDVISDPRARRPYQLRLDQPDRSAGPSLSENGVICVLDRQAVAGQRPGGWETVPRLESRREVEGDIADRRLRQARGARNVRQGMVSHLVLDVCD